jgi:aromatic ring-opening dioxygenase LigB subunit
MVFAAIAPHGDLAIPEACDPEHRDLARTTQKAMRELGRRFEAAAPDAVIVITPHNVHVEGNVAVVVSGSMAGVLEETGEAVGVQESAGSIRLDVPVDRALADAVLTALRGASVPALGISCGGNDPATAVFPLDWGSLIPLWYMGGRVDPPVPVVCVTPARDLAPERHIAAGRAIAAAASGTSKRIALVASADHAHTHRADGAYGFHPAARQFDELVVAAVRDDDLGRLVALDPQLIEDAKPDSWWQLLMLHGALGDQWRGELLSYEAPTYYGMLCAAYSARSASPASASSGRSARSSKTGWAPASRS